MHAKQFLAFVLAFLWLSAAVQGQSNDLLLKNARLLDPSSQTIRSGHLLIRGGRVEALLEDAPEGFSGTVLDVEGKWVIPGLADMHTHSFGNTSPAKTGGVEFLGTPGTAKLMLYAGVTSFLDLFSVEDTILEQRRRQRAGELAGADIYCAGPCITATGGHCTEYGIPTRVINTPDEARQQIGELAAKSPDVVKIVYDSVPGRLPTIDRPTLEAAIEAARGHGLKTVIHVGTWQDVEDAARAGASAVTHIPRGKIPEGLVELMKERQVASIPTLTVQTELAALAQSPQLLDSPLLVSIAAPQFLQGYRDTSEYADRARRWMASQQKYRQGFFESVSRLASGGVTMMAGTDAGNLGVFQGYSLHRELVLLTEAGLTPWQALAAATSNASRFLGRRWGVRPGDAADLVVLSASPLEDIANTQKIEQVIHHGKVVDRAALVK